MFKHAAAAVLALGLATPALAIDEATEQLLEQRVKSINPQIVVKSVDDSDWSGIYEVTLGNGETLFSDAKGEYFMVGQLFQLTDDKGFVNLSELKMQAQRVEMLASVPEQERILFAAEGEEKGRVTVFTDISCPYCVKLHKEIPALQKMGIGVEYLAFPRRGPQSRDAQTMSKVWCAKDPQAAMTAAKLGQGDFESEACDSPVIRQYILGQRMGVTGTPAILLGDGTLIPGYLPAAELAAEVLSEEG